MRLADCAQRWGVEPCTATVEQGLTCSHILRPLLHSLPCRHIVEFLGYGHWEFTTNAKARQVGSSERSTRKLVLLDGFFLMRP